VIHSDVKIEQSKLQHSFFKTAYIAAIPFDFVLAYLFWGRIDYRVLLVWLFFGVAFSLAAVIYVNRVEKRPFKNGIEYIHSAKLLNIFAFFGGCFLALASIATIYLPPNLYFLVINLFVISISINSSRGFNNAFVCYSVPVLIGIGISGVIYLEEYWYISLLLVIVFLVFITHSKYSENIFLDSIRIRFENNQLIDRLEIKKNEAERANKAKSVFLASASHDLRQPLHALNFQLASFEANLETLAQKDFGRKMKRLISSLNGLFDGILDVSKMDAGITDKQLEDFDVRESLLSLVDNFRQQANDKGLEFKFDVSSYVIESDQILFERIMSNLISNAIRYTCNGEVRVSAEMQDEALKIHVSDTGRGIPSDELQNIFGEFYQLGKAVNTKVMGFGLGLFIVKRLSELLDHELSVDSQPGIGSRFSLVVPLGDKSKVKSKPLVSERFADLDGLTVIVIDDDADIVEATQELLERWGCVVFSAMTSEEAMAHLEQSVYPDLIISDHTLTSWMTGIDVIEAIKAECKSEIPSLLMTGDTSAQRLYEAAQKGYVLLHKPVSPKLLKQTILTMVDSH